MKQENRAVIRLMKHKSLRNFYCENSRHNKTIENCKIKLSE